MVEDSSNSVNDPCRRLRELHDVERGAVDFNKFDSSGRHALPEMGTCRIRALAPPAKSTPARFARR